MTTLLKATVSALAFTSAAQLFAPVYGAAVPATVAIGQAVKCNPSSNEVCRIVSSTGYRCYPTPAIAASWDPQWSNYVTIDCSSLTRGPDLLTNPATVTIGRSIKCSPTAGEVFRLVSSTEYRYYPTPAIAASWDPQWSTYATVDCSWLTRGPDMLTNPATVAIGRSIKCSLTAGEVFRLVSSTEYRYYPTQAIAASWDPQWSTYATVDCSWLTRGPDMLTNPATVAVGKSIKCSLTGAEVCRLVSSTEYRCYPTPAVAASWDAQWSDWATVDCSWLTRGPDMLTNLDAVDIGKSIKCSASDAAVYRLVSRQIYRLYPNPDIASSWDSTWASWSVVDCSGLEKGDDMPMKDSHVNPDRGFYRQADTPKLESWYLDEVKSVSVVRRIYYLDSVNSPPLNATFLDTVKGDFELLRGAGKRVVLRFAYSGVDPAESVILGHLDQLRDILGQYSSSLLAFEAGFIGRWGEWFYTDTYGNDGKASPQQMQSRYKIVQSMADKVGPAVPIAVRTSNWSQEVAKRNASLPTQLALYDDCIYAAQNDLNTFTNAVENTYSYPFGSGGEVCSESTELVNPNDCSKLITALDRINATYVNQDFYKTRLDQYAQCNYANRLGYAIESRGRSVRCDVLGCWVSFSLVNTGLARPSRQKTLKLKCGAASVTLSPTFRDFFPGTTISVFRSLSVKSCPSPTLLIEDLQFPNDPRYSVKLTNAESFDAATGANVLAAGTGSGGDEIRTQGPSVRW